MKEYYVHYQVDKIKFILFCKEARREGEETKRKKEKI